MSKKLAAAEAKYQKEVQHRNELKKKLDDLQEKLQQADYKVALAHSELLIALQVEGGLENYDEMKKLVLSARSHIDHPEHGGQDV